MRLVTISDLTTYAGYWHMFLPHVAYLKDLHRYYRSIDRGGRDINVHISGDDDRPPGLHASELCSCLRMAYYSLVATPKVPTAAYNMKMRFDLGSCVHALTQSDFHKACELTGGRITFEDEVRINSDTSPIAREYDIQSSADGVFTYWDEQGQPYLRVGLEIKTMSGPEFDKVKEVQDKHLAQTSVYMRCLDLPLMYYYYYNKSNSNDVPARAPWVVPYDQRIWAAQEARAKQTHEHRRLNVLPDREEGMHCTWCPYAYTCAPAYGRLGKSLTIAQAPRRFK